MATCVIAEMVTAAGNQTVRNVPVNQVLEAAVFQAAGLSASKLAPVFHSVEADVPDSIIVDVFTLQNVRVWRSLPVRACNFATCSILTSSNSILRR